MPVLDWRPRQYGRAAAGGRRAEPSTTAGGSMIATSNDANRDCIWVCPSKPEWSLPKQILGVWRPRR